MIAQLRGVLVEKGLDHVVLDVNGVGYLVAISLQTLQALPAQGQEVQLKTYLQVREDALQLFGFATEDERRAFELCISVSGVGPKLALATLSGLDPAALAATIGAGDVARLTKIPGIGKKTAERLVLELRDKLATALPAVKASAGHGNADVLNALLALGYNDREATAALRGLPPDLPLADAIRQALKALAKP